MQSMDTIGIVVRVLMLIAIVIGVSSVRCRILYWEEEICWQPLTNPSF